MIDYIYDIIKTTEGEEIAVKITDEAGAVITEQCYFHIFKEKEMVSNIEGKLTDGIWYFTVPAIPKGSYEYCIGTAERALCFKSPFYLV